MRVALIGGSGFIGRNLCRYLLECGHEVLATTRQPGSIPFSDEKLTWLRLDLGETPLPETDLRGVDCVVYLAARAHVLAEQSAEPLAEYRRINRDAALALARRAAAQGVGRFIYLSSIGVNGVRNQRPFCENDEPMPEEDYALSKLEAERELEELAAASAMELVILRPPLVYGRGAPGNFGRLLAAVEQGRWLPLAAVHNRRSFIAIENLVQVIEICLRHPRAANRLFLVADGIDLSTAELVRMIGVAIGKPARLLYVPVFVLRLAGLLLGKSREIDRLCASLQVDSSRARDLLEWRPAMTPQQSLQNMAA